MKEPLTEKERAMWEQRRIERIQHVMTIQDATRKTQAIISEHGRNPDEELDGLENYADFGI